MKKDTPLDQFVRAQIASTGSNIQDPAVNLYTMIPAGTITIPRPWRWTSRRSSPACAIQCSQCHNHPFDRWTQDDYYGFVSFFTGVKRKEASEAREFYVWDDPNAAARQAPARRPPVPAEVPGRRANRM